MANKKSLQQGGAPEVRNNLEYLLSELQDKIQNQNIPVQQSVADLVSEGNNPQEIAQALLQIGYKEDDIKQIFNSLPTDEESSEVKQEAQQPQQQQAVEQPQMQQEKIQQMQQEGVTAKKGKEMHSSIYDIPKAKQGMGFRDWMRQAGRHGSINQNQMYQAPEARYLPMQKESYSAIDAMKNIGSNLMDFIDKTKTWNDNKEHLYNYKANVPEGVDIDDYATNIKELYRSATENKELRTNEQLKEEMLRRSRMSYDPKMGYVGSFADPYSTDEQIKKGMKKKFGANYMKRSVPINDFQGLDYDQSQAIGDYMYNKYRGNMPRGTNLGMDQYGMPTYQVGPTDYDIMLGKKKFNTTQDNVDNAMNNLYNRKGATLDWVKQQIPNIEYGNAQRKPYWNGSYWEGAHPGSRNTPGYGWDNKKTWIWGSNKSKQLGGGTHNTYYAQIGGEPLSKRQWVAQNPAAQLKTASEIDLLYSDYTNNFQYDYDIEYEPEEQTETINFQDPVAPTATITNKGWGDFRKGLGKFGDVAETSVNITGNVNKFLKSIENDKQLGDATHQSADGIYGIDNPEKGFWTYQQEGILQPDHQTESMAQKGAELYKAQIGIKDGVYYTDDEALLSKGRDSSTYRDLYEKKLDLFGEMSPKDAIGKTVTTPGSVNPFILTDANKKSALNQKWDYDTKEFADFYGGNRGNPLTQAEWEKTNSDKKALELINYYKSKGIPDSQIHYSTLSPFTGSGMKGMSASGSYFDKQGNISPIYEKPHYKYERKTPRTIYEYMKREVPDEDRSKEGRKKLAEELGIEDYDYSEEKNTELLEKYKAYREKPIVEEEKEIINPVDRTRRELPRVYNFSKSTLEKYNRAEDKDAYKQNLEDQIRFGSGMPLIKNQHGGSFVNPFEQKSKNMTRAKTGTELPKYQKEGELFPYSSPEEKASYGNYWQTIHDNAQKLHREKMINDPSYRLEQGNIDNKKYLIEPELYGDPHIGEFIAMYQDGNRVPREQVITDPNKLREFIGLRQEDKMPWLDKFYPDIKSKKAEYIKQPGGQINPFSQKKRQLRKRTGGQVANISTEVLKKLQAIKGAKFNIL
jgi:hypothetical protein